jgi:hypothetical protein
VRALTASQSGAVPLLSLLGPPAVATAPADAEEVHEAALVTGPLAQRRICTRARDDGDCRVASGYYERFFARERLLGRGSYGSVFVTHHMLDGVLLGTYAVKKVPVGFRCRTIPRVGGCLLAG